MYGRESVSIASSNISTQNNINCQSQVDSSTLSLAFKLKLIFLQRIEQWNALNLSPCHIVVTEDT